jgi:hypothetical protein
MEVGEGELVGRWGGGFHHQTVRRDKGEKSRLEGVFERARTGIDGDKGV